MEEEIKQLKIKRGSLKKQLTMFETFLHGIDAAATLDKKTLKDLSKRLNKVEPLLDLFVSITVELTSLQDDLETEHSNELKSFQDRFFEITSEAEIILEESNCGIRSPEGSVISPSQQSLAQATMPAMKRTTTITLPTINLPTFDGDFTHWREFKDKFESLIANNPDLADTQKLTYLKSALKGEPAELLISLITTDANYSIAWARLEKRYNNKRRIINNHVIALLNIPSISRESYQALRTLITTTQNHVDCLKTFDVEVDSWDALLIPILCEKLDSQTSKEWENKLNKASNADNIPTLDQFLEFLSIKQNTLETHYTRNKINTRQGNREIKVFATTQNNVSCSNCNKEHLIINCEAFLKLSEVKRNERARELKLCLNCLRKGHFLQNCQSRSCCKKCKRRHHTLIHKTIEVDTSTTASGVCVDTTVSAHTNTSAINDNDSSEILLSTAKVVALNEMSTKHEEVRVLLDSGSQSNFVTMDLCQKLNLQLESTNVRVCGINAVNSALTKCTKLTIKSRCNKFQASIQCFVLPEITHNLPTNSITLQTIKVPLNIKLADPTFNISGPIDILIGATLFYDLLCIGQIKEKNAPTWQKTKLGWIASGNLPSKHPPTVSKSFIATHQLHKQVEKFWNTEELHTNTLRLTQEEHYCENYFKETTTRELGTGRFIVKIPLKVDAEHMLGNSSTLAKTRLISMENRFKRNISLQNDYNNFMSEYLRLNHMTKLDDLSRIGFFLPHHAVVKPESQTTKLRVVFDGSCKLEAGLPVNDIQCVGPTIQQELVSIIGRFRTHQYVLTADITKMYRQVLVHPSDRKYQLIMWRFDPQQSIDYYELNTVTYGTAAAPFLAIRSLIETANEHEKVFPIESRIIKEDFYVDDLLTGANSVEKLKTIKENIVKILNSGGFSLSKWTSNNDRIHMTMPTNQIELSDKLNKTLGVFWNPQDDTFTYSTKHIRIHRTITKRTILANASQLFDPLGLLSPTIIYAKILLQDIWREKVDWDQSLSLSLQTRWLAFQDKIHSLNQIRIPRKTIIPNNTRIEIHVFSDASTRGFGACLYLKSVDSDNNTQVHLLTAKSRVSPIKFVSIPRLELCAAVLAARLVDKFKPILNLKIDKTYYWCDSQIVICWLKSDAHRFNTYVANRVTEVQSLSNPSDWHYVKSNDNPADYISRGVLPHELHDLTQWWHGPSWLINDVYDNSNNSNLLESAVSLSETKKKYVTVTARVYAKVLDIQRFSSLTRLIRVTAYVLRFGQKRETKPTGELTTDELNVALKQILKMIQQESFSNELNALANEKTIDKKCKLLPLAPFLDEDGILRVGGRLSLSQFTYDKKHPIILPKSHHFTDLIFNIEHKRLLHAGPNLLLSAVREKYWPINGKNTAKRIVRNCIVCTKYKASVATQMMGNLPQQRLLQMHPFHSVGIDYGGPFWIKDRKGRGSKVSKAYLCLFICFSTKALHLEVVTDLSVNAFIATLRRFVSRRGKPSNLFSDNATTFTGANRELQALYDFLRDHKSEIETHTSSEGVQWHFIPPYSANFGGLWEAGIKSTKHHLKRVLGDVKFTYEDFCTLLYQIESILNSRPLCPLSSDPNDLVALTPAHFLIGRPFTALPDPDVKDIPTARLDRFQHIQQICQHFWSQWSKVYVSELQHRQKWCTSTTSIKIGTMVLLKMDNVPPAQWRLGRVVDVHPGQDNLVRVVSVQCASGIVKRSVSKLVQLPVSE